MAVVKAFEDYLGRDVTIAPYPGEMGAIGAALLAKEHMASCGEMPSSFIGFDRLKSFSYETDIGSSCDGCANHCDLMKIHFSTGKTWITGNRCEKGAGKQSGNAATADVFKLRQAMLFAEYPFVRVSEPKEETVGIPRVLEFWDSMPFWTTFFKALGYKVKISDPNTAALYEEGISYVASDTICFPAKLVHGALSNLIDKKVDRIFFPYIMHMPPEGVDKMSPYVCSVLQGYPMVTRNSQELDSLDGIVYDAPVFHWFTEKKRKNQIITYAVEELHVTKSEAENAFDFAETAIKLFRKKLTDKAESVMAQVRSEGKFAVVLAGRPYHSDPFVSHHLSDMFTKQGIAVLPADSLPNMSNIDLANTRVENECDTSHVADILAGA